MFEDSVTLIADDELWENAKRGLGFDNFLIAHELGHLILDHHATCAGLKYFQLTKTSAGMSRVVSSVEEREADLAAVFFQCGSALLEATRDDITLARLSYSDVGQIMKARRLVQLDVFHHELRRPRKKVTRVIL